MSSSILDVALGLALIFATFALVASGITDLFAGLINLRGRKLYGALEKALGTEVESVLNHPLLRSQNREGGSVATKRANTPSYLPSWAAAIAILQRDLDNNAPTDPSQVLKKAVEKLPADGAGGVIRSAAAQYGNDLDKVTKALEAWFDSYMERVSGWYKRNNQWILLLVGVVVAVVANVNVIGIGRTLMTDDTLRTQLADQAISANRCDDKTGDAQSQCVTDAVQSLPAAKLGLFWTETCPGGKCTNVGNVLEQRGIHDWQSGVVWVVGVLIGGIAISLGAPFWFDLIGRGKALKGAGEAPAVPHTDPPEITTLAAPIPKPQPPG